MNMNVEINETVANILEKEAQSIRISTEELVQNILTQIAQRSRFNDGRINHSGEVPSGLL